MSRHELHRSFGYDGASRLRTASDGVNSAAYNYAANSPLVGQITFKQGSAVRMTTTKSYDNLNRLTQISTLDFGLRTLDSHSYAYNSANQRTQQTDADSSSWAYGYDPLGHVTSGNRFWPDGTPVAGQQFEYAFDDIGNRKTAGIGGDASGNGLRYANYNANALNQYLSRDVPGYVEIAGTANPNATVAVFGGGAYSAALRNGQYFNAELPLKNVAGPVYATVTNLAVLTNASGPDLLASTTGDVFLPQTPEHFAYDADGNLMSDGRWTYSWDAENRLVNVTGLSSLSANAKLKLDFAYDQQGRRISKVVSTWNSSTANYQSSTTNLFIYDSWNLIAELNASNAPTLSRSYLWGLDLSGAMRGAGGVGGLLTITDSTQGSHFAAFDANGNVTALVNATDGTISAQYEYGPFGEIIRATGPTAKVNPFRFSTKYQDDETDLLYYGYRYYHLATGRWLSRDPIDEDGSKGLTLELPVKANICDNVYCWISNEPLMHYDLYGLLGNPLCGGYGCIDPPHSCPCPYANPCAEAKRRGEDHGDMGGVVCCGGVAIACIWTLPAPLPISRPGWVRANEIIAKCLLAHERRHAQDGCNSCTFHRQQYLKRNLPQAECDAYYASFLCFAAAIRECGNDADCRLAVKNTMKTIGEAVKRECGRANR
jgi:RHS repeat-associated protein